MTVLTPHISGHALSQSVLITLSSSTLGYGSGPYGAGQYGVTTGEGGGVEGSVVYGAGPYGAGLYGMGFTNNGGGGGGGTHPDQSKDQTPAQIPFATGADMVFR